MDAVPCPHCHVLIRQVRSDGRCGGCGHPLPDHLRASPQVIAAERRARAQGNPSGPPPDERSLRCRHLLLAIGALHQQGYQLIRVAPILRDTAGGYQWLCSVVPAQLTHPERGSMLDDSISFFGVAKLGYLVYPFIDNFHYFDPLVSPDDNAQTIVQHFPKLAEHGKGIDDPYASWYADMLRLTAPYGLIIGSHAAEVTRLNPPDVLYVCVGPTHWWEVPLPPPRQQSLSQ